jgi:Fic family protein
MVCHPYTKIDFVMQELQIHRNTAIKDLEELLRIELLTKHKIGKENFYLNTALSHDFAFLWICFS